MCNLIPLYRDEWITLFLDKKHLVYDCCWQLAEPLKKSVEISLLSFSFIVVPGQKYFSFLKGKSCCSIKIWRMQENKLDIFFFYIKLNGFILEIYIQQIKQTWLHCFNTFTKRLAKQAFIWAWSTFPRI